jgi:hypothetical protein
MAFSGGGFLNQPAGIAVTDSLEKHARFKENFIVIVDSGASRISMFDLKGNLKKSLALNQLGFKSTRLEYICLDYHNQILVTDSENHCIHKFTHKLEYITSFGREGDDDFEFQNPTGITIHRRFGQIFVAEESGAQYYWVGTDLSDLTLKRYNNNLLFTFKITEPSFITADIIDDQGDFVMRLTQARLLPRIGEQMLRWNKIVGKTNEKIIKEEDLELSPKVTPGKKAPPGEYTLIISLEATYSSRTHFVRTEKFAFEITE